MLKEHIDLIKTTNKREVEEGGLPHREASPGKKR